MHSKTASLRLRTRLVLILLLASGLAGCRTGMAADAEERPGCGATRAADRPAGSLILALEWGDQLHWPQK